MTLRVPVEEIRPGDVLALPSGLTADVQRVDRYDDKYVVRWARGPILSRPHPLAGERETLGSLAGLRAGELVALEERARVPS